MTFLINPYRFAAAYDTDAQAYITAVEAADGQALETGVRDAINAFVVGCKADGIWTAIKASCILAGARTLAGALVPLVGTAPTNNNFVSGDYNRETGLAGDGSTKRLNSNCAHSNCPKNNGHISVYASSPHTTASRAYMYALGSSIFTAMISTTASPPDAWIMHDSGSSVPRFTDNASAGFRGVQRSDSTSFSYRTGGTTTSVTRGVGTGTPGTETFWIYAIGDGTFYSDARLAFYSIGESLDLFLLDSRVSTLLTAIAAAIP